MSESAVQPVIRPAAVSDSAAISALITTLCERFIVHEFPEEGRRTMLNSCTPEAIESYIEQGFDYHVATDQGQLVGVVGTRDDSHLYHLFVREDWQATGLSRSLWELAKSKCERRGNPGRFTVNSSTNAIGVYERFGFQRGGGPKVAGGVTSHPMTYSSAGDG